MRLAILATTSMPLKYWDESFLAATYLINRAPTKVLDYDTPIIRLLGAKPDYSSLSIFGCACWPNLHPYNAEKLQFCAHFAMTVTWSHDNGGHTNLCPCIDVRP
jgi:hypothetical protein